MSERLFEQKLFSFYLLFGSLRDLFEQTGFVELATRVGDRVVKSADEMEGNECVSMKGNEAP